MLARIIAPNTEPIKKPNGFISGAVRNFVVGSSSLWKRRYV